MPTYLAPLDLKQNELRTAVVQNLSAAPTSPTPVKGQIYFDTSSNSLYFYDGTTWQVAKGGTGGPPTGAAGGDLTGSSYPNPVVANSAITYAKIQNVTNATLLGKGGSSPGPPAEITLAADLGFVGTTNVITVAAYTGGDVVKAGSATTTTVRGLNGTTLSGLATGLLKNTTATGVPSIAVAADIPTVAAGATGPLSATDPTTTNSRAPSGTASGDLSGSYPGPTVFRLNGQSLAALATGILKNTTSTGVPVIAAAADIPTAAAGATGPLAATSSLSTIAAANASAAAITASSQKITNLANGSAATDAAAFGQIPVNLPPSGAASGDLSGTYPGPNVKGLNGTTLSGLATGLLKNTTATGVPSIAAAADVPVVTAGTSATGAMSAVSRLDQIASANAATASVGLNNQKIVNLLDPTGAQDAATKNYVDATVQGIDVHPSVRLATTGSNLAFTYAATGGTSARGQFTAASNANIDGVALAAGNRILVKDQTTPAQNGIYVITTLGTGANGVWDRATDFDQDPEVTAGAFTFVEEGTANGDSGWILTTNNPIVIGGASGTSLAFAQFSGAGQITAGNGLTKTGNTIDIVVPASSGLNLQADQVSLQLDTNPGLQLAAGGISVLPKTSGGLNKDASGVYVDFAGTVATNTTIPRKWVGSLAGSVAYATGETLLHSLGTRDIQVTVINQNSPWNSIEVDWEAFSTTQVIIRYNSTVLNPTGYRVVVMG